MKRISRIPKWLIEFLLHWPVFSMALWLSDSFFDGIYFQNVGSIFISSFILTALNLFIKPIILLLALPLAVLSLGLIIPFINGLFIMLVSELVDGFYVDSYMISVLVAVFVSLLSVLTQIAVGRTGTSIFVRGRKKTFTNQYSEKNSYDDKTIIDVDVKEKNK